MAFFLTHKAKADLKDIARYTQKEWGVKQRDAYLTKIDRAFHLLAYHPDKSGRSCDDIEIVRILHGQMDVNRQFGRD